MTLPAARLLQVVRGLERRPQAGLQLLAADGRRARRRRSRRGRIISRTGQLPRCSRSPARRSSTAGAAAAVDGCNADTPTLAGRAATCSLLGLGLGMVMQALDARGAERGGVSSCIGVATSGATLFRSIGGSLGTAILGAVFTARLTSELPAGSSTGGLDPSGIDRLPAAAHEDLAARPHVRPSGCTPPPVSCAPPGCSSASARPLRAMPCASVSSWREPTGCGSSSPTGSRTRTPQSIR